MPISFARTGTEIGGRFKETSLAGPPVDIASANRNKVKLIEPLREQRVLNPAPEYLLYDKAADSDPLRHRLQLQQIELVCRYRSNRSRPPTQDGRAACRLSRSWRVERTIAWLQSFR